MTAYLTTPEGRRIAYDLTPGTGPGVVFLGGYRSDMTGTKVLWLQDRCRRQGRAFVRFDYSGNGVSGGAFEDGCIGDWAADAAAVLALTEGPQVLVGSSMGGWIALLLARAMPDRVAGLVGVAAAPDFTEDLIWALLTPDQQAGLMATGRIEVPSSAFDTPDVFTRRMIEDGRDQTILHRPLVLPMPVRLLHGTADTDAPFALGLRLLDHATGPDIRLTLVKGAGHRFSTPECLTLIGQAVDEVAMGRGDA